MKTGYIPPRNSDRNVFAANYKEKLSLHAEELNLKPDQVSEVIEIIDQYRDLYLDMISQKAKAKAAAERFREFKKPAMKELRRFTQYIKTAQGYTNAIGEDLQIIGSEITELSSSEKKPELKLKVNGQAVDIRFKKGKNKGINIYSRRGNETEFKFLLNNSEVHYFDDREKLDKKKPEQREYYAYFVEENREIGKVSDVVKAVVP